MPREIRTRRIAMSWKFFIDGSHCSKKTLQFRLRSVGNLPSAEKSMHVCANRRRTRMTTREKLPKKIAVLMGGPGSEREVSLAVGRGVAKALQSLGDEVIEVDVRKEDIQLPNDVDLAFNTIHGTFGEDGQIQ